MKKRFLILAGVLALTVAVSGCGKKKDTDVQPVVASATPTPEVTKALLEVLEARELIKINILKNSPEDPKEVARLIAERTSSELVQVIGRKAVLYKPNKDPKKRKIELNG